jgi:hypothetical protein
MTLVERVKALADAPNTGHAQRRRGMTHDVAQAIVAEVVADVLAIVEPFVLNAYGGDVVLKRLRVLGVTDSNAKGSSFAKSPPPLNERPQNGAGLRPKPKETP